MILLTATTDSISLTRSTTADIDVVASYFDFTQVATPVIQGDTAGRKLSAFATAATADIVDPPAASESRNVKEITISNKHATASNTVTVNYDANGTLAVLVKRTLRAGDTLHYSDGKWQLIEADNGNVFTLASDVTTSSTTMAEITGLSQTTGIGIFVFRYYILVNSAATTTGHKFGVNHTGTVTSFNYHIRWVTTAAAASDDVAAGALTAAAGAVVSAFAARAKTTAATGTITDVDTAASDVMFIIEGHAIVTADGDLELWWAPEAAASATLKAGSLLAIDRA